MAVNINFKDYKSSGVYFIERDNSIIESTNTSSSVLVVGLSKKGPFNAPVYLESLQDLYDVYGSVDRKLERKGCFFNRSLQTILPTSSVYALNLMPIDGDAQDEKVGVIGMGMRPCDENLETSLAYADMYDKSRFWKLSSDYLSKNINDVDDVKYPISFANVGTSDFTLIVRKAENLNGFDITVRDWYGEEAEGAPYSWMRDMDYMSDYFIQVICVNGKWNDKSLASDLFWKKYFDYDSSLGYSVLKKDKVNAFLRLDQVSVIGNYTGCIIPNFVDKTGVSQDIKKMINVATAKTGLMMAVDEDILESDDCVIDMVGHTVSGEGASCHNFSYNFDYTDIFEFDLKDTSLSGNVAVVDNTLEFYSSDDWEDYISKFTVGTLAMVSDDKLSKIIKRQIVRTKDDASTDTDELYAVITFGDMIDEEYVESNKLMLLPTIQSQYSTLNPIFLKGYDIDNKIDKLFSDLSYDEVTELMGDDVPCGKIYSMLDNEGIGRGLLNDDLITFRYIVDTMGHGLGTAMGSKKYLSKLAYNKKKCTAMLNAPSITEFANCSLASFYDADDKYKTFKSEYVVSGGNDELPRSVMFSLPTEEEGAKCCGIFSPFLEYTVGGRNILVPPAADVTVAFLKKNISGDPYATVANRNGILKNSRISGVEYQFDRKDQDNFEPFGINPILYRNGEVMIYGDRTAYQEKISDYNYLHVRELLNTIEIECNAILQGYVFRYNNAVTRAEVVQKLTPILQGMQDNGALYKFEIQMDENNNTDEVIDRSFALVDIGVWITKNMEKIVTTITVNKLSE